MKKLLVVIVLFMVFSIINTVLQPSFQALGVNGIIDEQINTDEGILYVETIEIIPISDTAKRIKINIIFKSTEINVNSPMVFDFELIDDKGNSHRIVGGSDLRNFVLPLNDVIQGKLEFVISTNVIPEVLSYKKTFGYTTLIDLTNEISPPDPKLTSDVKSLREKEITNGNLQLTIEKESLIGENPTIYKIVFSVKNVSDETQHVWSHRMYAKDWNGNIYSPNFQGDFASGEIYPGQEVEGVLFFEMYSSVPDKMMFFIDTGILEPIFHTGYDKIELGSESLLPSEPTVIEEESFGIPYAHYKNDEFNFSIDYPAEWKVTENYQSVNEKLGIVSFNGELGYLSVWGKWEDVRTSGNEHLKVMPNKIKNQCEEKSIAKDGFACRYDLLRSNINKLDDLTRYVILFRTDYIEPSESQYEDFTNLCLQEHIDDNGNMWELNGCYYIETRLLEDGWEGLGALVALGTLTELMDSFKILEVDKSVPALLLESSRQKIPDWIKNNAKWWSEGAIDDNDFTSGIEYMIRENIIVIPNLPEDTQKMELKDQKRAMGLERDQNVPDWVRNNAGWWADGQVSDDDFVSGMKYLVEQGIIKV